MAGAHATNFDGWDTAGHKLCCALDNHATKNGLARSSSVLPVNHSLIIISLLSNLF